jgi:hypothetical protein
MILPGIAIAIAIAIAIHHGQHYCTGPGFLQARHHQDRQSQASVAV